MHGLYQACLCAKFFTGDIKIMSRGQEPSAGLVQEASKSVNACIHKISKCHWILQNEHRSPIINRVHAPTKVTGCTKYEYCGLLSGDKDGTEGRTDRQTPQDTTIPYGPGIARLCAFSLLVHSNSKRHIKLSNFLFFT